MRLDWLNRSQKFMNLSDVPSQNGITGDKRVKRKIISGVTITAISSYSTFIQE